MTTIVIKKGVGLRGRRPQVFQSYPWWDDLPPPSWQGGGSGAAEPRFNSPGLTQVWTRLCHYCFVGTAHQLYYAMSEIVKPDAGRSFKLPRNPQYVVCVCEKAICFVGCYRPPTGLYYSLSLLLLLGTSMCLFIYLFCWMQKLS